MNNFFFSRFLIPLQTFLAFYTFQVELFDYRSKFLSRYLMWEFKNFVTRISEFIKTNRYISTQCLKMPEWFRNNYYSVSYWWHCDPNLYLQKSPPPFLWDLELSKLSRVDALETVALENETMTLLCFVEGHLEFFFRLHSSHHVSHSAALKFRGQAWFPSINLMHSFILSL